MQAIDEFSVRLRRRENGGAISAWVGTPDPLLVSHLAQEAFDAVVLDMQHGMWDLPSFAAATATSRLAGKPVIGRIPVGDFASASRMLDAGASGIIAPMINSVGDAKALATATKYPPIGERSWGPSFALNHTGLAAGDYLKAANELTVAIAMIETRAALEAIDDILGVEGIDGIFIGPSDLSIALSNGASLSPNAPEVDKALHHAVARAKAHGKIACAFAADGERAGEMLKFGFHLTIAGAESNQIRAGARSAIAAARRIASGA